MGQKYAVGLEEAMSNEEPLGMGRIGVYIALNGHPSATIDEVSTGS